MRGLGLDAKAVAARRKYVQAGDVGPIMAGEWKKVWRQKMGLDQEENLDDVLAVQMGSYTEPFNFAWAMQQTKRHIHYYSGNPLAQAIWLGLTGTEARKDELQVSDKYPWMACNLDALALTQKGHLCVADAKHVGKADEQMMLRYTPGMTHQAIIMATDWWALSLFIGNSKWEWREQEIDPFYAERVIETTREFWEFVEHKLEPDDRVEPAPPPKPQPVRRTVVVDLEHPVENWMGPVVPLVKQYAETKAAADANHIARKGIEELLPEDVGLAKVGLVDLKRDGRGFSISLKRMQEAENA